MTDHRARVDLPRFSAAPFADGVATIVLDDDESRHALTVLRMRPGEPLIVVDLCGHVATGVLDSICAESKRKSGVRAVVRVEQVELAAPPANPLTLIVAPPKGPRLDWMVEKCTELGVARLVLAAFERSVVRPGDGVIERSRRRSNEVCKQCERAWAMEIEAGDAPSQCMASLAPNTPVVVAHPGNNAGALAKWRAASGATGVAAVIGPEGGLSPGEVSELTQRGAVTVSLGANILRVETAAIAAAALLAGTGE